MQHTSRGDQAKFRHLIQRSFLLDVHLDVSTIRPRAGSLLYRANQTNSEPVDFYSVAIPPKPDL
jgi:hypothetical protein